MELVGERQRALHAQVLVGAVEDDAVPPQPGQQARGVVQRRPGR
ncbi:MAG TPA: hypothetical protein VK915_09320 [Gaiellaceae bacterium]|nr:hypothetical protein [Gaiellaceae bacterium]